MTLARKSAHGPPLVDLYEHDFYRWLRENASLLRTGRLSEADVQNIAEELEDRGRSERRALASHIAVLILHLLKWQFQPSQRSSGWRGSIYNARRSILRLLGDSPSLRGLVPNLIIEAYQDARFNAANETGLPESAFPDQCPYTPEALLDEAFWPQ